MDKKSSWKKAATFSMFSSIVWYIAMRFSNTMCKWRLIGEGTLGEMIAL